MNGSSGQNREDGGEIIAWAHRLSLSLMPLSLSLLLCFTRNWTAVINSLLLMLLWSAAPVLWERRVKGKGMVAHVTGRRT